MIELGPQLRRQLLTFQRNEITEYHIYRKLADTIKEPNNRKVLSRISNDEYKHYEVWKKYTGKDVRPAKLKVWFFYWIARIFGLCFSIKLMEHGEENAQETYGGLTSEIDEMAAVAEDENSHENALLEMIDEERLRYTGSIVLGLNDALVELTGALAGLTLALQNARLIALSGCITGVAAAFSMAASEYLSTKSEETDKDPLKAAVYTGLAYILTVIVLIFPYLILPNYYLSLVIALVAAIVIIFAFNYYISVAKDVPFRHRFLEMAGLSMGVAGFSFAIGFVLRILFNVDV